MLKFLTALVAILAVNCVFAEDRIAPSVPTPKLVRSTIEAKQTTTIELSNYFCGGVNKLTITLCNEEDMDTLVFKFDPSQEKLHIESGFDDYELNVGQPNSKSTRRKGTFEVTNPSDKDIKIFYLAEKVNDQNDELTTVNYYAESAVRTITYPVVRIYQAGAYVVKVVARYVSDYARANYI